MQASEVSMGDADFKAKYQKDVSDRKSVARVGVCSGGGLEVGTKTADFHQASLKLNDDDAAG